MFRGDSEDEHDVGPIPKYIRDAVTIYNENKSRNMNTHQDADEDPLISNRKKSKKKKKYTKLAPGILNSFQMIPAADVTQQQVWLLGELKAYEKVVMTMHEGEQEGSRMSTISSYVSQVGMK